MLGIMKIDMLLPIAEKGRIDAAKSTSIDGYELIIFIRLLYNMVSVMSNWNLVNWKLPMWMAGKK